MEGLQDTDKTFCRILFDVMIEKGVRDVVCSPGSRNAPLLLAASARDELRKHVAIDERSSAFMALGMAIAGRRPVALVCTSGTALLNYGPAVAEAFYQSVPLIVISADRPEQWIDQDDSQTLRQFEAFSNYVKKSYQLPAWGDDEPELQWYANRIANDAIIEACSHRKGPVHVNVRLGEPLGRKKERMPVNVRTIEMLTADGICGRELLTRLADVVARRKVMFVAGFLHPDSGMQKAVAEFCSLPNVVAMTETLSNLHLDSHACCVDSVLSAYPAERLDSMAPDLVISVGGSLVSRKLKEYLRRNSGRCEHWSLGWHHTTSDCFQSLTSRIEADPARLLHQLAAMAKKRMKIKDVNAPLHFSKIWRDAKVKASKVKLDYVEESPWSELKAFKIILDNLPRSFNLFLSNGTSVRYAQLLAQRLPHASYCNRGVSGIDGCTSTAVGCAKMYGGMTLLVTGDMSMAYDLCAFGLPDIPDCLRIIVVDNQGGGIFRFIPTTSGLEERERYFCACPHLPLPQLADGYGWEYMETDNEDCLRALLPRFFIPGRRKILRVTCDGVLSADILKGYMAVTVEKSK